MNEHTQKLREYAQSILAGVQRLEELNATEEDRTYVFAKRSLQIADSDIWAAVDHLTEGGRGGV